VFTINLIQAKNCGQKLNLTDQDSSFNHTIIDASKVPSLTVIWDKKNERNSSWKIEILTGRGSWCNRPRRGGRRKRRGRGRKWREEKRRGREMCAYTVEWEYKKHCVSEGDSKTSSAPLLLCSSTPQWSIGRDVLCSSAGQLGFKEWVN